ncbi:MAG: energy-coupled thiamine transporter ThiT [Clostridia bacterium]|nr:energy-coupled thiamine transporter ThiT [Clostridia bacterium]
MQLNFNKPIYKISLSAVFIALATALSTVKIYQMPMGGSVTLLSMLPICLIPLLYGTKWGLISGFAYGTAQLVLGLNNLSYATNALAAVTIILFDYLLSFTVLGFSGIFLKYIKNKTVSCTLGVAVSVTLRFICHFITGVTVWRELTGFDAVIYSLLYNGSYMLPELILTVIGCLLIFKTANIKRILNINS